MLLILVILLFCLLFGVSCFSKLAMYKNVTSLLNWTYITVYMARYANGMKWMFISFLEMNEWLNGNTTLAVLHCLIEGFPMLESVGIAKASNILCAWNIWLIGSSNVSDFKIRGTTLFIKSITAEKLLCCSFYLSCHI